MSQTEDCKHYSELSFISSSAAVLGTWFRHEVCCPQLVELAVLADLCDRASAGRVRLWSCYRQRHGRAANASDFPEPAGCQVSAAGADTAVALDRHNTSTFQAR